MMIFDMADAEKKLGYVFKDKGLLRKAFTHSSYINENQGSESNEILEFFGDSVLGFVVKENLVRRFPEKNEGELTSICQNIVSTAPLAKAVLRMRLNEDLLLGMGEAKNSENQKICEDLFEALVAAIYLDGGLASARSFILESLAAEIEASLQPKTDGEPDPCIRADKSEKKRENKSERAESAGIGSGKPEDPKSKFSELMQKRKLSVEYVLERRAGPDHAPRFFVQLCVAGKPVSQGEGGSKKTAEMEAARLALESERFETV